MPNARSLVGAFRGNNVDDAYGDFAHGTRKAQDFREGASRVTRADLEELGVPVPNVPGASPYGFQSVGSQMTDDVDVEGMKFQAMKALRDSQRGSSSALGVRADGKPLEQTLKDLDFVASGKNEVLRQRQKDFNQIASDAVGTSPSPNAPNPHITGLTGAAYASQARAGRPQASLPREQHDPIVKQQSMLSGLRRARTSY